MDFLRQDLRYALRRLRRSPGFTAVAVLSLALGIGANTAIFSLVDAVLLRDAPVDRPEELVDVYVRAPGFSHAPVSYPEYRDIRDATGGVFRDVATVRLGLAQADADDGGVEPLPMELVTGNYFPLLGIDPAVGRTLSSQDDVSLGGHPVVMLGWGYWQRAFGGDPGVVGREIRLTGRPYTVVGVAPRGYVGSLRGLSPDVILPVSMVNELEPTGEDQLEIRGNQSYFVKGRLAEGATLPAVRGALDAVVADWRQRFPERYAPESLALVAVPSAEVVVNPMIDRVLVPALGVLLLVVGVVLLIACANLASFLLARAADRRREIAVRLAMGARRGRLVRQLLVETVLLALLGGAAGLGLAAWILRLVSTAELPLPVPIDLDLRVDGVVLAFTAVLSLAAGILFGLAPALQATDPDVAPTLKNEATGGGRPRRVPLRSGLVVGQVALSLMLLTGAGLMLRSMVARQAVDPGFGSEPAAIVGYSLPPERASNPEEGLVLVRELEERIRELPGVEAVGTAGNLMMNTLSYSTTAVEVPDVPPPQGQDAHMVDVSRADAGYFDAVGLRILRGRGFTDVDEPDAPPVAVVNETFARRFFGGVDAALGQTYRSGQENPQEIRIVGVMGDTKVRSLGEEPRPYVLRPLAQSFDEYGFFVVRTAGDPRRTLLETVEVLRAADPGIVIYETRTMERHLAVHLLPSRLSASLAGVFAALALTLAAIGLYGVVSYAVARRTREVGIRVSLGAEPGTVVRTLMAGGLRLVAVGGALGLALSIGFAVLLSRFLYGVEPFDPLTFAGVPALLAAVGVLAAWVPARRAARIDPVRALKAE